MVMFFTIILAIFLSPVSDTIKTQNIDEVTVIASPKETSPLRQDGREEARATADVEHLAQR